MEELERRGQVAEAARGPAPASTGATNTSSLSTRPASRNAVASVGPPSSRSDWTPSAASARSSSSSGPLRSSSSDPSGSGPRPKASRRGCLAAPTSRASSRGRVGPHRPHPDRDRVGSGAQLVHPPPRLLARHPAPAGNGDAAVERDRRLVGDERPAERLPDAPRLVLPARGEVVEELDLDPGGAQGARGRGRRRPGSDRGRRRPRARRPLRRRRRRRAACGRGASTARASRRAWRRAPRPRPARAR